MGSDFSGSIDTLNGGDGDDDTLFGGDQADTIDGGNGRDICDGGDGDDLIEGGNDGDALRGRAGNDTLSGEAGEDLLCGGATDGTGHDSLYGYTASANEVVNELDKLWSPSSANTPVGNSLSGDLCGHTSHGNTWSGNGGCTYTLSAEPGMCN